MEELAEVGRDAVAALLDFGAVTPVLLYVSPLILAARLRGLVACGWPPVKVHRLRERTVVNESALARLPWFLLNMAKLGAAALSADFGEETRLQQVCLCADASGLLRRVRICKGRVLVSFDAAR